MDPIKFQCESDSWTGPLFTQLQGLQIDLGLEQQQQPFDWYVESIIDRLHNRVEASSDYENSSRFWYMAEDFLGLVMQWKFR